MVKSSLCMTGGCMAPAEVHLHSFLTRHEMEVSGQVHSPDVYSPGKEPPLPSQYEAGRGPVQPDARAVLLCLQLPQFLRRQYEQWHHEC
jgi:hypothetical protein